METRVEIGGVDVTRDLTAYLLRVEYEDHLSGEADTLTVELMDKAQRFIGEWFPTLSDTLRIELRNGEEVLDLGTFEIDEVEAQSAPTTFRIKAVSVSQNSALRQCDQSRSWENVLLSEIANDIAQASGVELFYQATEDPTISRAEQGEESRLAFLAKICADNFLTLKISDGRLIIVDEAELDKQEAVTKINRVGILDFSARKTLQDVYGSCEVSYRHGTKDEIFQGRYEIGSGKILKINKRVDDTASAEKLARNKLREKNKKGTEMRLKMRGRFELLAGVVIELEGFGAFDGRYLIEKAKHTVGEGYTTQINCRQCLEY